MYKPLEQIEKEYNGNWVLMVNCQENEYGTVIGGEVMLHDTSMNKVLSNMQFYNDQGFSSYVRYVGTIPEGVALVI